MPPPSARDNLLTLPDDRLLEQCRLETFRGPGPGGQKRNKTSSAVRLVHEPTGLSATAGERRSQALNRRNALARLRHRAALEYRQPSGFSPGHPPEWFTALLSPQRRLVLPRNHPEYLPVLALVLDVLAEAGASVSAAAEALHLTTANLVRFLQADPKALAIANQCRRTAGLKPLGDRPA